MLFSPKQQENWRHTIGEYHRWNMSYGATRSGKTYLDYYKIPQRIRRAGNDGLILLLGNTKATLERNILDPMRKIWTPALVGNIGSNNKVRLFGREVYALGADKISSVKRIQGAGLEYCYGDEVTTWAQGVFDMLKSRLDKMGACFDGTCNPDNPLHWAKRFIESDADIYSMRFRLDDNPFNPARFVEELKKEYRGTVYYDRLVEGLWVAAEGVIYRQFADSPARYIIDAVPVVKHRNNVGMESIVPDLSFCQIGVDFGGTKSAQAFQCSGISLDYKSIYTLDEYYSTAQIIPSQLEEAFVNFVRAQINKGYKVVAAYADSAEQVLIRGLRAALLRAGIAVPVVNALKGRINDRIRFYTMLHGCDRYKVLRHCNKTIEAFSTAVWDPNVVGDERLDDGTYNIDTLDALEYSTEKFHPQILQLMMTGR